MNYRLAREIYGHTPLCVDGPTFAIFLNKLSDLRRGIDADTPSEKLNSSYLYNVKTDGKFVAGTMTTGGAPQADEQLIYVINLNGPITKEGGLSTYGIKDLIAQRKSYEADNNVIGGILVVDSGGGSGLAMELMQHDLINERKKPMVTLIERAGCACSAAAGIGICTDWVMAESADSEIGSFGTLINFSGYPDKAIDGDGAKQVTIYATASTKKNEWFREAINNDNYKVATDELLDPFNDRFKATRDKVRPQAKKLPFDGEVYKAGDVIGTLVDEIGGFKKAADKVIELSKTPKYSKQNNSKQKNNTAMTAQEFKAAHPEAYAEIFGAGVAAEKSRTAVWMKHLDTDAKTVVEGISSGEPISDETREELLIKGHSKTKLKALQGESAESFVTEEAVTDEAKELTADDVAFANLYGKHKITLKSISQN